MCGITGYLGCYSDTQIIVQMRNTLIHRGNNDSGVWFDQHDGIYLGHQRLSILDLSPTGYQPMYSPLKRYVMVFNGEIYNHLTLRNELSQIQNIQWRGHSDTETLLAGFDFWGVEQTVKKTIGMFAFAVWDMQHKILILGRDRIGEKPLYYGWQSKHKLKSFLFASELKAFKKHPAFEKIINQQALMLYLRYGYIPAPLSIYENIYKLNAGYLLQVSFKQPQPQFIQYWSAIEYTKNRSSLIFENIQQATNQLESILTDAVQKQMLSDVPLGAFLSGGIDSSTIVTLMQQHTSIPIKTFTIGFDDKNYNEANYAKNIASYLKTDHTELYVNPIQLLSIIEKLPYYYDEPFADTSQIPTFLVSQLAKQSITVALSGDGGDELFCGYNRYIFTQKYWYIIKQLPLYLRTMLANYIQRYSINNWDKLEIFFNKKVAQIGTKLYKTASVLTSKSSKNLYQQLISQYVTSENLVCNFQNNVNCNELPEFNHLSDVETMMLMDLLVYLPDDILVKVDRASMAHGLETRAPFLDHRVVEFAWQLPVDFKLKHGQSKYLLRQILFKYIPQALFERPKMGFSIPIHNWLSHELRDLANDLFNPQQMTQQGYLNPLLVNQIWQAHLAGKGNYSQVLWSLLIFQLWLKDY